LGWGIGGLSHLGDVGERFWGHMEIIYLLGGVLKK